MSPRGSIPEPKLSLTSSHHELLHHRIAAGLASATARLADTPAADTQIVLHTLTSSTIADFDPDAASRSLSSDVIAGVLQRFEGRPPGTTLFVLDPGDALLWLQREGATEDPLGCFVDWGGRLLSGVVDQLCLPAEVEYGAPVLEERPLVAALLATHPASDTVVLSVQGQLVFSVEGVEDDMHAPFSIHVLLEPKFIAEILSESAGDTSPISR